MSSSYFRGRLFVSGMGALCYGIMLYDFFKGNKGLEPGAMLMMGACVVYLNCLFTYKMLKAKKQEEAGEVLKDG